MDFQTQLFSKTGSMVRLIRFVASVFDAILVARDVEE